jgi:acetyl esterase/lipase
MSSMDYAYDPELAPIVAALPRLDLSDIAEARTMLLEMRAKVPPFVAPETVDLTRRTIPGPAGAPPVGICVITPRAREDLAPGLLWIHGGGFVLGDIDGDLPSAVRIAEEAGAVVASVGYRLAPEHPYPAAVDDCYTALRWLAGQAGELGIDPERIAVGGISAGAGLAAALALAARDRGGPPLCFQLLEIPELDDRIETESIRAFNDTPLWTRDNAVVSWSAYLGPTPPDPVPPYAAPARASDMTGLPSAYVVTCEFDPLRDEGIAYATRLIAAGVPTELHHYPGTFHGASGAGAGTAIASRMIRDRIDSIRRGYDRARVASQA